MTLKFLVQGSGQLPYTITAEGAADTFRAFCTCPAGRKGGLFCKHIAALLVGDVTKLVQPSDDVMTLAKISQGSPLVEKAMAHRPKGDDAQWQHLKTLEDVARDFSERFTAQGLQCEIHKTPGELPLSLPREELRLYSFFKNGKIRKTPSHVLYYEPLGGDAVWLPDGTASQYTNIHERERPWGFKGKTKATLARIIPDLIEALAVK